MGFQTSTNKGVNDPNRKHKVHPIWRGVGCFMALLIPLIGYSGALILLDLNTQNRWVSIPSDLLAQGADPMLYVKIGLTFMISFFLYVIFMLITFIINSAFGPSRYGPLDARQQRYKGGGYKR